MSLFKTYVTHCDDFLMDRSYAQNAEPSTMITNTKHLKATATTRRVYRACSANTPPIKNAKTPTDN